MKFLFAICLLSLGLLGCIPFVFSEDAEREAYYINNSGVDVKLIIDTNEQEIKNNDTLCNFHLNKTCSFGQNWEIDGWGVSNVNSTYSKIEFLSEPKVCLVFEGDTKVGEGDIRYWENYLVESSEDIWSIPYYYTITPDLMQQQAKEEFCGE